MKIKVKTDRGEVLNYTFVHPTALELFVKNLPPGWEVVPD